MIVVPAHHPGYITEQEWNEIRHIFKVNTRGDRQQCLGPGPALLQGGIIYCGIHGYRMNVGYGRPNKNGERYFAYRCVGTKFKGGKECITVPGPLVDRAVEQALLQWLQPPQLGVLRAEWIRAQQDSQSEEQLQRAELDRARVAAEEADARYHRADRENDLVRKKLEKRWQEAEEQLERLKLRARCAPPPVDPVFTDEGWNELLRLATNLEAIWNAPTTENRDRKEVARTLLDRVLVEKQGDEVAHLTIRRSGGGPDLRLEVRLVAFAHRMIAELAAGGLSAAEIAGRLNSEGLRTHKGQPWSERTVSRRLQPLSERRNRRCT